MDGTHLDGSGHLASDLGSGIEGSTFLRRRAQPGGSGRICQGSPDAIRCALWLRRERAGCDALNATRASAGSSLIAPSGQRTTGTLERKRKTVPSPSAWCVQSLPGPRLLQSLFPRWAQLHYQGNHAKKRKPRRWGYSVRFLVGRVSESENANSVFLVLGGRVPSRLSAKPPCVPE